MGDGEGMGPVLDCTDLRKAFGEGQHVVGSAAQGLSLSIDRGELFALLGPSGCGKTTTLRLIGGFLTPETGRILIEGVDVTASPPHRRPTNTVFQNYALFPHLSVAANIGFGLRMERRPRSERRRRIAEVVAQLRLDGLEDRHVGALSGGQQQRVALARALAKRPNVLLLDEPLGALDLQLRKEMQDELVALKGATTTTFLHVTHDQEEAFAIADRVGIMEAGQLVQVDRPSILHQRPANVFVARFLDLGTIVRGTNRPVGDEVDVEGTDLVVRVRPGRSAGRVAALLPTDGVVITPAGGPSAPNAAVGTITRVTFAGATSMATVLVGRQLTVRAQLARDQVGALVVGDRVQVSWDPTRVAALDDHG